jgi:hypothetical protein
LKNTLVLTTKAAIGVIILLFSLQGSLCALQEKQDWDNTFIVGIIEPCNRTEIAGRLEIAPLFVERMEKVFTDAHYKVIRITNEMLYQGGFDLYHESEPDTPLTAEQILRISEKYKLDVLITGNIFDYQKRSKAEFFHVKEFWRISMEGLVHSSRTGKVCLKVPIKREERVQVGSSSPPWQKQILDIDISTVNTLASELLSTMGRKPQDTTPPTIEIRKPQDAQLIRTSVVLLLGEVSDNSEVYSLTVNGEEKEIAPRKTVKLYYPVTYVYGKEKEHITLSVVAKDIYGNTSSRTIGLTWGKPLLGEILKIEGKEILINIGTRNGAALGMTFMACNVETYKDPLTGQAMFNFVQVGPVIVTKIFPTRSECTFFHPEKAERMKKGDIVR